MAEPTPEDLALTAAIRAHEHVYECWFALDRPRDSHGTKLSLSDAAQIIGVTVREIVDRCPPPWEPEAGGQGWLASDGKAWEVTIIGPSPEVPDFWVVGRRPLDQLPGGGIYNGFWADRLFGTEAEARRAL